MPTFAESIRATLTAARAIPGQMGLREHSVTLVTERWTGGAPGLGSRYDDELAITEGSGQNPKVRQLTDEEIAVGALPRGTLEVGPMTPSAELDAALRGDGLTPGTTQHFVITGPLFPNGARFSKSSHRADRALRRVIQLKPVELAPEP